MPFNRLSKDDARSEMSAFVAAYQAQRAVLEHPDSEYTETDARTEFIDRFLTIFGWDVRNEGGQPQSRREVVLERTGTEDAAVKGRPDYRIKVVGHDRLPVEAKKPAVRLSGNSKAAVQARSYGYSLSLPAAVLTNVAETIIFDTTFAPNEGEHAHTAVRPGCHWSVDEYVDRFDELWAKLAYEIVATDAFFEAYEYEEPPRGDSPFDQAFLADFRKWRLAIATDLASRDSLDAREIGRRTQQVLNALLFLRVYEDRHTASYEHLLRQAEANTLAAEFARANRVFNAAVFSAINSYAVSDDVLASVVRQMYWPQTKYAFALLEADTLAAVYEQYLAEEVVVLADRRVVAEQKPEHTHASGIVTTPQYIVDALLDEALGDLNTTAATLKLLDPACGSGVFLVTAFKRLVLHEELSTGESPSLERRAELVRDHLFGVDIDNEAVEVARLGLLLAILGDEDTQVTSRDLLPDLGDNIKFGNSVIGPDFDELMPDAAADGARRAAVNPFDWTASYPTILASGGFTAIAGNPPYIRIQVLRKFASDQLDYFQHAESPYKSPAAGNFDAYMLFIERCLTLLAPGGTLAFIVQHRFANVAVGAPLRAMLAPRVKRLVHFGEEQIFPRRSTYTALLVVGDESAEEVPFDLVRDLKAWRESREATEVKVDRATLTETVWPIADEERARMFETMRAAGIGNLGDDEMADIFVGVQTSADKIYFVKEIAEESSPELVTFLDPDKKKRKIERGILRPSIKRVRIAQYDSEPDPSHLTIFPYDLIVDDEGKIKAEVFSAERMAGDFPLALDYLMHHKYALSRRNMADPGDLFWRYGRAQNLVELEEPKIIIQVLSLVPRTAVDTESLLVTGGGDGGPYYLLRPLPDCEYSINVLQALLSHPAVDAFIASHGKAYRGSYVVHRKAFLEGVPVPALSAEAQKAIEEAVEELHTISLRQRTLASPTQAASDRQRSGILQSAINRWITEAYGLTEEQVASLA